jgi:hypothetical protein
LPEGIPALDLGAELEINHYDFTLRYSSSQNYELDKSKKTTPVLIGSSTFDALNYIVPWSR